MEGGGGGQAKLYPRLNFELFVEQKCSPSNRTFNVLWTPRLIGATMAATPILAP